MNSTQSPFPPAPSVLKLARRASSAPASEVTSAPFAARAQSELAADLAALQEREANLRAYEERLRAWQEQLDASSAQVISGGGTVAPFGRPASQTPFQADTALSAAWEKLHRTQAIFEAEKNQVRDDRMALREAEANLRRREAELDARERQLGERERQVAAMPVAEPAEEAEVTKPVSAMQRLTQAPWAVFRGAK